MSSISFIGPQYVCCDIISRLTSDVQLLHQELQLLRRLQSCYKSLEEQYHCLLDELNVKLAMCLLHKEIKHSDDSSGTPPTHKIQEFIVFIRRVWINICHKLEKSAKNDVYISFLEGSPFIPILDHMVDYVFFVSRYYMSFSPHPNCSTMFNELLHQVMDVIYPEMFSANEFEKSLTFVTNAIPCLINLFTIMDIYTYTTKFDSVASIVKELAEGVSLEAWKSVRITQPTLLPLSYRYLVALLDGELLGNGKCKDLTPMVDHDSSEMSRWIQQMTDYVLKWSVILKPPMPKSQPLVHYKTIAVPYQPLPLMEYGLPVMSYYQAVPLAQAYYMIEPGNNMDVEMTNAPAIFKRSKQSQHQENPKQLKKGASINYAEDSSELLPIKMPQLSSSLKPFDY